MKYSELLKKADGDRCIADMATQMKLNRWYCGLSRFEGMCVKLESIGTLSGDKWRKIVEIDLPS